MLLQIKTDIIDYMQKVLMILVEQYYFLILSCKILQFQISMAFYLLYQQVFLIQLDFFLISRNIQTSGYKYVFVKYYHESICIILNVHT